MRNKRSPYACVHQDEPLVGVPQSFPAPLSRSKYFPMRPKIITCIPAPDDLDIRLVSRNETIGISFSIQNEDEIGGSVESMVDEKLEIDPRII